MSNDNEGGGPPLNPRRGPIRDLANFAEALRGQGLTVTSDQVGDMARSLLLVDPGRRHQVHAALRSLSITDPAQRDLFDEEFRRFFEGTDLLKAESHSRLAEVTGALPILDMPEAAGEGEGVDTETGASDLERLARRDFADLDGEETTRARQLIMTMLWQPADFRTRRWVASPGAADPT